MTTRYRVEYALKSHRRDPLIEWIKALLAVPFVLHSQPNAIYEEQDDSTDQIAQGAQRRYLEIMRDVEEIINDHGIFDDICRKTRLIVNSSASTTGNSGHFETQTPYSFGWDVFHTTQFTRCIFVPRSTSVYQLETIRCTVFQRYQIDSQHSTSYESCSVWPN